MQTPMIVIFFTGNCSSLLLYAKKEQTKKQPKNLKQN